MRLRFLVLLGVVWLWIFGHGVVWGEDGVNGAVRVEMDLMDCQRLLPGVFASSANYIDGVDVYGREIASASGGGISEQSLPPWLPKVVSFDLQVDLSTYSSKLSEQLNKIGVSETTRGGTDSSFGVWEDQIDENHQAVDGLLSTADQEKKAGLDRDIEALRVYEEELLWTRRAIAGNSVEMAERLIRLQNERKVINSRVAEQETVLLSEKQRVIAATGGGDEKNEGLLLLRGRQLQQAEARYYYGEGYLRLQRTLIKNSDAQERVRQEIALKDKSEKEGIENASLVNERALQKTRTRLEELRMIRSQLMKKNGIPEQRRRTIGNKNENFSKGLSALPYDIDVRSVGGVMRVEYDMAQGLLLLNGHPLEPKEITNLIRRCKGVAKRKDQK